MSLKIRVIIIGLLLVFLILLIKKVQKKSLDLRHALSWIFLVLILIVLALFPNLLIALSRFMGITSPVNMIFFCGFLFSLVIIFALTTAVSKLSEEVKRLAQKIALLEDRIRSLEGK